MQRQPVRTSKNNCPNQKKVARKGHKTKEPWNGIAKLTQKGNNAINGGSWVQYLRSVSPINFLLCLWFSNSFNIFSFVFDIILKLHFSFPFPPSKPSNIHLLTLSNSCQYFPLMVINFLNITCSVCVMLLICMFLGLITWDWMTSWYVLP